MKKKKKIMNEICVFKCCQMNMNTKKQQILNLFYCKDYFILQTENNLTNKTWNKKKLFTSNKLKWETIRLIY